MFDKEEDILVYSCKTKKKEAKKKTIQFSSFFDIKSLICYKLAIEGGDYYVKYI